MGLSQSTVAWSNDYALGLAEIDEQHKFLFHLIDDIWRAVASKADRDATMKVIAELERYTVTHFAAEEAFMREQLYSRYQEHRLVQHIRFTDRAYADEFRDHEKAAMQSSLAKFFKRFLG